MKGLASLEANWKAAIAGERKKRNEDDRGRAVISFWCALYMVLRMEGPITAISVAAGIVGLICWNAGEKDAGKGEGMSDKTVRLIDVVIAVIVGLTILGFILFVPDK